MRESRGTRQKTRGALLSYKLCMTSRNRLVLLICVSAVLSGLVVFWQVRIYRTPPKVSINTSIISASDILSAGPAKDGIPAINDPDFETVPVADQYLKDDGLGIDLATTNGRRFYPFQILTWHFVVNDTVDGKPITVVYCPLCQDGAVYSSQLDGQTLQFGTSGQVWNSISLLYDQGTGSLWTASGGLAISGPLVGKQLAEIPSHIVPWGDWKINYPDGQVLSRNTGADRDYTFDPYGAYQLGPDMWFPIIRPDARLPIKTLVIGLQAGGKSKAYQVSDLASLQTLDDTIGQTPVTVWSDPNTGEVSAFERSVKGQVLTFFRSQTGQVLDRETGSSWDTDGQAISGTYAGTQLTELTVERTFWFCWAALHPSTDVYTLP